MLLRLSLSLLANKYLKLNKDENVLLFWNFTQQRMNSNGNGELHELYNNRAIMLQYCIHIERMNEQTYARFFSK